MRRQNSGSNDRNGPQGGSALKKIFKYKLEDCRAQTVEMLNGAHILSVQKQDNETCIWALVDPDRAFIGRRVYRIGTGQPIPWESDEAYQYIGTVVEEIFVWHYFIW